MDVDWVFKFKTESQNFEHGCIKDLGPSPNQDQDGHPQSGTSSVLQSPKSWFKGHGCSLHLQNQEGEPKIKTWVYKSPVTIYKSRSRQDANLQSGTFSILQSPICKSKSRCWTLVIDWNILHNPNIDWLGFVKQNWRKSRLNWTKLSFFEPFIAELGLLSWNFWDKFN